MAGFQIVTPVKLGQAAIATTLATLYTAPASTRTFVKDITLANTAAVSISATVHLVPSGGSATAATQLVPSMAIAANTLLQWKGVQTLNAGDTIQTIATATGVTINASGGEAV